MTIEYDAGALTGWCGLPCLLSRWRGTIWHGAVLGPMFWLSMLTHVLWLVLGARLPVYIPASDYNGTGGDLEWRQWTPRYGFEPCTPVPVA